MSVSQARRLVAAAWTSGLPHYTFALIAVQGATFVSQLVIARLLPPAAFGVVRVVEVTLGLALVAGSAGLPSLAIKSVASLGTASLQGTLLRRLLSLVIATSGATAILLMLVGPLLVASDVDPWLMRMAFLIVPMAVGRTCLNYFQGIQRIQRISLLSAASAVVSLVGVSLLVARYGMPGWVAGRFLGESLTAAIGLALCLPLMGRREVLPPTHGTGALLSEGGALSLSLLVRAAMDAMPVLALGWFGVQSADIGFFGLGSLITAAVLLLPGAVSNVVLPRSVAAFQQGPAAATASFRRMLLVTVVLTVPLSVLLWAVGPALINWLVPDYAPGIPLLRLLLVVVPMRALTTTCGAFLLAGDRVPSTVRYNVLALACTIVFLAVLVPSMGVRGAVYAIVLSELLAVVTYLAGAWRRVRAPLA